MNVRRIAACAATAVGAATVLTPMVAAPAGAVSEPEILAEGLNNPYKLTFGPDGALYVAEAGVGGDDESCVEVERPEGADTVCIGATGSVTRIEEDGDQERVVEGLASLAPQGNDGNEAIGPSSVAVGEDGTIYVVLGLGGDVEDREALGAGAEQLATIVAVPEGEDPTILADLLAFEAENDPDAEEEGSEGVDSNPFDIEIDEGGLLAIDAGGNDILRVDEETGEVSLGAVFPFQTADAPPFLELPPGTQIPVQPVPTSVSLGEQGLLVGELTGFPFPPGGADVYSVVDDEVASLESGFTNIIDIAQGPDGVLYVLEFASEGLLNVGETAPPTSRLVQVRPDGTRKVLLQGVEDGLITPAGIVVGPDGMVYVSNGSQLAGEGTVFRIDPSVPRDPATASACIPDEVPGTGFGDIAGNTHAESIECLVHWGAINGIDAETFAPNQEVTRGQVATILVGALDLEAEDAPDAFDDDDGNVHEGSINTLAALGLISGTGERQFSPNAPVSRGQLASIMLAVYNELSDVDLVEGPDAFTDDDGTTHEFAINAVAAAGWITGKSETTFGPSDPTTRGQLASLVARLLSTLVDDGIVEVPAAG